MRIDVVVPMQNGAKPTGAALETGTRWTFGAVWITA